MLIGLILTIVYPIQNLFSGNQNVYFVWALAKLNPTAFAADPLLNSPDPYPLFSWLVSLFSTKTLPIWTSTIYWLLNVVYVAAFFGIANTIAKIFRYSRRLMMFLIVFLFLHSSPIWGTYIDLLFHVDLRWIWDSGIAEQGVLRGYLQPSVFGVFLLLSFHLALKGRFSIATLAIIPAALFHANYVFLGGILTILYVFENQFSGQTILAGAVSLVTISPYLFYLNTNFIDIDVELQGAIANAVALGFSENIHLNPLNWLNTKFFIQVSFVFLTILLVAKRHRILLIAVLSIGILLSAAGYLLESNTLISLNPWRLSITIIPSTTSILLGMLVRNWSSSVKSILPSVIVTISIGLVVFRLFGNGSDEFHLIWIGIQIATFIISLFAFWFIASRLSNYASKFMLFASITSLITVRLVDSHIDTISKSSTEEFQAIEATKGEEPKTIYIIPPDWTHFRLNATKAVFVDKNLVYGPALPNIMTRLELIESANYAEILALIPQGITVKLIAHSSSNIDEAVRTEPITNNYNCYVLRQ